MNRAGNYNPGSDDFDQRELWARINSLLNRVATLEASLAKASSGKDVQQTLAKVQVQLNAVTDRLTKSDAFVGANGVSFTSGQDPALSATGVGFTISGSAGAGTIAVTNPAAARAALSAAQRTSVGAHTMPVAKITGGGTDGSITWNADGCISAFTDPT